jgi:hypothetical protein
MGIRREPPPAKTGRRTDRDNRLAQALRANLKRRKAGARTRKIADADAGKIPPRGS